MEGECSKAVQGGNADTTQTQRATKKMEEDPPITVAFVFQPSKAEGNPCRQSGISISSRRLAVRYLHRLFSRNRLTTKEEVKGICALFLIRYTSCQTNIDLNRIYISL